MNLRTEVEEIKITKTFLELGDFEVEYSEKLSHKSSLREELWSLTPEKEIKVSRSTLGTNQNYTPLLLSKEVLVYIKTRFWGEICLPGNPYYETIVALNKDREKVFEAFKDPKEDQYPIILGSLHNFIYDVREDQSFYLLHFDWRHGFRRGSYDLEALLEYLKTVPEVSSVALFPFANDHHVEFNFLLKDASFPSLDLLEERSLNILNLNRFKKKKLSLSKKGFHGC